MSDLDTAIRAVLDDFCTTDWCAEKGRAAIEAVLELHPLNDDHQCVKEIIGYTVLLWYRDEPCPTLLAIAKGLGIET